MHQAGRFITRRSLLRGAGLGTASALISGKAVATASELGGASDQRHRAATNARLVDGAGPAGEQRIVWSVDTTEPAVALTFDDGPDPDLTPLVLTTLREAGVVATFLVVGERAAAHPALIDDILAGGHELGSHSMSHLDLSDTDPEATAHQVAEAARLLQRLAGEPVRWFRPPWGRVTGTSLRAAADVGQDLLLWSASAHGLGPTAADIGAGLPQRCRPGSVVLLHDGVARKPHRRFAKSRPTAELVARRRQEIAALPALLDRAREAGTRFVTASELSRLGATSASRTLSGCPPTPSPT